MHRSAAGTPKLTPIWSLVEICVVQAVSLTLARESRHDEREGGVATHVAPDGARNLDGRIIDGAVDGDVEHTNHLPKDEGERGHVARSNVPPERECEECECDIVEDGESGAGVVDVHGRRTSEGARGRVEMK